MPPSRTTRDSWWQIILRHFASIVIVLGALWWLATPRVEAYVRQVVEDRFVSIELKLDQIKKQLQEIQETLDKK